MKEHREALVVGINCYPLTKQLQDLEKPAADAEAVAQLLEKYGNFKVQRLPEAYSPEGKRGVDPSPPPQNLVTVPILETAIAQLFNPSGKSIPGTALLFFAGHGLRKVQGGVTEGFLATSDVKPEDEKSPIWGVSLRWLRELLQKSPVRQQIILLDCCHSGELLNILDEANPGKDGKALDRCWIAACREFEVSREQLQGEHGILTAALLQGLEPDRDVDGFVTNYKLADFINQEMSAESQRPIFHNSGNAIILTDKMLGRQRQVDANLVGKCPYKALEYFTQEDAVFFYGRTALTDELIDQVRTQNFIAVLGASGSGKSSVLRAGLLYQLKRGQKLSGSDRWKYYDPFTPGEHPLASLENAIGKDTQELSQFIQTSPSNLDPPQPSLKRGENLIKVPHPPNPPLVRGDIRNEGDLGGFPGLTTSPTVKTERVVLVIDQFEECFTMCQDKQEREEFFVCLLEAVEQSKHKLCLVLGMRADFLGKCAEYAHLADKIDQHVMVKPMTRTEIREAIKNPADLVGLQVEEALVTKMTEDVIESLASLPLLQYTLTELWNEAQTGPNSDRLMLESYTQLGGIEKTLPKRANEVYASLKDEEKPVAKRIFLELTQLGETSDTRRRVYKEDLVNSQHSEELLDRTIEQLVQAKLIVTTNESKSQNAKPGVILDIVHEALIRHWQELRQWVAQNQVALEIERKIEARAKDWERNGKTEDLGLLLQGATLIEAETYLKDYGNLGLLDGIAQEYIQVSQIVRDRLIKEELERKQRELKAVQTRNRILIGSLGVVSAVAVRAFFLWRDAEQQRQTAQRQETIATLRENVTRVRYLLPVEPVKALILAIKAMDESKSSSQEVREKTFPQMQSNLNDAIAQTRERDILQGHERDVTSVAFSPDGKTIVSGSADKTIRLWDTKGNPIGQPFKGHEDLVISVAFSPDGKTIVSGSDDKTIRLWDTRGNPIGQPFKGHQSRVSSVAFSPDGKYIISGSWDKTVRLWDTRGNPIGQPFKGDNQGVSSVAFSPDGKYIVSGGDKTIRLWDTRGNPIGQPFKGHEDVVNSVAFSLDGKYIVSGSLDKTIRLWDTKGNPIGQPFTGHEGGVSSVAFSPDGKTIVSGSWDKTIRLWDTEGNPIAQPLKGHENLVDSVAFSPDGKTIASGGRDKMIRLWDTRGNPIGQPFKGHQSRVSSVAFSPDGKYIVSGSWDKTVRLWDTRGNPIGQPFKGDNQGVSSVAFSPDGKYIVSGGDKTIRLWDTRGNPIGQPFTGHEREVYSVAFSPDGKTIASGGRDKTIRLWDTKGNSIGQPFTGHQDCVSSVAFSPDGKTIVSGSWDRTIRLWDTKGNPIGQPFTGHHEAVSSVAFSPDGKTIVSGSWDRTIRLWDTKGNPIGQPFTGHHEAVSSVAFSPDGKTIVSGSWDRTIRLWDTKGNPIGQPFTEHQGKVYSVAFSPDGKTIVSGSEYRTIRLWRGGNWLDWLGVACERLIEHPILVAPETLLGEDSEMIEVAKDARSTCQKLAWKEPKKNAEFLVNQGRAIGRGGNVKGAMTKFQQARKLSSNIQVPTEEEVGWWAAGGLVEKGEKLVKEGKVKEALAAYQEAKRLKPTWKLYADSWNTLCRYGSLHEQVAAVTQACEKAVALAPINGEFRDSRGIARAMTGDKQGAIEDFQAYIKSIDSKWEKKQRQGWIDALKAGRNPFTPEEIERLLRE